MELFYGEISVCTRIIWGALICKRPTVNWNKPSGEQLLGMNKNGTTVKILDIKDW